MLIFAIIKIRDKIQKKMVKRYLVIHIYLAIGQFWHVIY